MLRSDSSSGVSIIIPTLNGGDVFKECLSSIDKQDYLGDKEIIVIDSGSTDGTPESAKLAGARVQSIDPEAFHHSRTRNEGVKKARYPIVVLLVQDAVPVGTNWLTILVNTLKSEKEVVAAYGRPLPQPDADLYARYEVETYRDYLGNKAFVQRVTSKNLSGMHPNQLIRLARIDNICAAYRKDFLEANPFPEVTFAEDLAWGLATIKQGKGIIYVPDIEVYHSHNRSAYYRFKRALVETINCAEIFHESKSKIPKLTANEINTIFNELNLNAVNIKNQINEDNLSLAFNFIKMVKGLNGSMLSRVKQCLIIVALHKKMTIIFQDILSRYPCITSDELSTSIDQILAGLKGRLLGAVYLKYKFKGQIPKDISEMVTSNLTGV